MEEMIRGKLNFKYYQYCRYDVDVTFQQSNRQIGNATEGNFYIGGNQKLYGYKMEVPVMALKVSVLPTIREQ